VVLGDESVHKPRTDIFLNPCLFVVRSALTTLAMVDTHDADLSLRLRMTAILIPERPTAYRGCVCSLFPLPFTFEALLGMPRHDRGSSAALDIAVITSYCHLHVRNFGMTTYQQSRVHEGQHVIGYIHRGWRGHPRPPDKIYSVGFEK